MNEYAKYWGSRRSIRTLLTPFIALVSAMLLLSQAAQAGQRGYPMATDAGSLKSAHGLIYDWSGDGAWILNGRWSLSCYRSCSSARLRHIKFDMAHSMTMSGGGASHSHQYSNFSATSVDIDDDNVTIEGTITGSGPIGDTNIVIKLAGATKGNATFFFELVENAHIGGEIGGVILSSQGRKRYRNH